MLLFMSGPIKNTNRKLRTPVRRRPDPCEASALPGSDLPGGSPPASAKKKKKQEKSDPTMPTLLVGVRRWPDGDLTPQHESRTSTVPQQAAKLLGKRTMESPAINIFRGFSAALATARCRGIISRERWAPTCKPVTMLDSRVASSRYSTSCWIVRASWPSAPLVAPA